MREIKVKVSFEKCAIQKDSLRIVSGDYNSTKLVFEFDREDGIKILEMNDPEDNLLYNGVIENNEVVLVGKDEDDNPCSLFAEEGIYPFEVVLIHDGESKLTAVGGKLKITAETVTISDSVVTPELPVFDQLLERVSTALNNCEEAVEDIYNAEAEAQEIISDFESNVEDYTSAFNANATNKTNDFNTNAAAKTTAFNDNAASKTETFNTNASEKTSTFNTNAAAKTAYFDNHAEELQKEVDSLKTVRNAIPKITGEGTEITLDKTAEATFEKLELSGNCEQTNRLLPNDYTQVDYIESSGMQYINTGLNITTSDEFDVDIMFNDLRDVRWFGNLDSFVIAWKNNYFPTRINGSWDDNRLTTISDNERHKLKVVISNDGYQIYCDDILHKSATLTIQSNNYELSIFKENTLSGNGLTGRLYRFKAYQSGILVRDLIPCYKKLDNVVGLYDIVNNVFYTNQGTGSFAYGDVVGIPNPDYPQDIRVVSGENEIKVCGKNLLKINDFTATSGGLTYECKNGIITVKGTATGTSSQCNFFQYINQEELDSISNETQLTFSVLGISGVSATQIWLGTSSSEYYWQPNATTKMTTRKKTNNISVAKIYISTTIGQKYDIYINPQLEIGSQATSYEPHKEQIKHITLPNGTELAGIGDYKDEIRRSTGKNLFDKDTMTLSNTFVNPTIGSSNGFTSVYVSCKPNTTYSISKAQETSRFYVATTESKPEIGMNATVISSSTAGTVKTFTTGNNANYIIVMVRSSSDTLTEEQIVSGIQIEEGSQATDYEPYGVGVWYKYGAIDKVVLDGSEAWSLNDTFSEVTQFNVPLLLTPDANSIGLSTHFIVRNDWNNNQHIKLNNVNSKAYLYIDNNIATDIVTLKQWLSTHNTKVYYVLATPTVTEITDVTLIAQLDDIYYNAMSYKGQTNITQTPNDAPFYLDVEALYDLEDLLTRVSALEG